MRFSQIRSPVFGVDRLHDVAGIVHEQGPVVDHRRGLIGALIHGPDPLKLQILHVRRGDLVQRAVVVGVIVVPDHQPVGRIGIAQHGVGDGSVVLHRARNRQTSGRWSRCPASAASARGRSTARRARPSVRRPPEPTRHRLLAANGGVVVPASAWFPARAPLD